MDEMKTIEAATIDATEVHYRQLNARLRALAESGAGKITINNVCGQRYIGTDLRGAVSVDIHGTPGNDMGAFMDGPTITVYGNAQDGTGNTMNEGRIVIHGRAGDITGLSARGGEIYVRDGVGYRAGIHMKEYNEKRPALVIGGTVQDFAGEYMAGGVMVLLGIGVEGGRHTANFIGTGMHGGVIYYRGYIEERQLGKEVGSSPMSDDDTKQVTRLVNTYSSLFGIDAAGILQSGFTRLYPKYLRPYGRLYTY